MASSKEKVFTGGKQGSKGEMKVYNENEIVRQIRRTARKATISTIKSDPPACNIKSSEIEKPNGKEDYSGNANARRNALVDVSNIQKNYPKKVGHDVPKKMKAAFPANKRATLPPIRDLKVSSETMVKLSGKRKGAGNANVSGSTLVVGNMLKNYPKNLVRNDSKKITSAGTVCTNVSRPLLESSKVRWHSINQRISASHCTRQDIKGLRACMNNQKSSTQNLGQKSIPYSCRLNANNSFAVTRKSLPVLKRVNKIYSSNIKVKSESSEKTEGNNGFPLKARMENKVASSQLNIYRATLQRNRVSDGFILTSRTYKDRTSGPAEASSAHIASRMNRKISDMKLTKDAEGASKKKEKADTSFLKKIPAAAAAAAAVSQQGDNQESSSSSSNKQPITNKSKRRRSYTSSLLVSGSRLLEEHSDNLKQDRLPSIDDDGNQLDVAEYVDEIYQYYWVSEAQNVSLENYMEIQTDVTPNMRGVLINWLIEVHLKFDLMEETLYLMVTLFDQFLSLVQVKKNQVQLVGLTALLLASKYEDLWHPLIKDLISISAESYTRNQMLRMESLVLKTLKFRLNAPTAYVFMLRFLKAAQSNPKLEHLGFYLIELCLVEYEALKYKHSLLCASAIYLARCTLRISPAWTPLLVRHARYQVSDFRECGEMMLKFHKAASTSPLSVTYEKYTNPHRHAVAAISPLENLPL